MLNVSSKTIEACGMSADEIERTLRRLNAEGKNDREIARVLGIPWATVNSMRQRLGLPAQAKKYTPRGGGYSHREESVLGDMSDCGWDGEPVKIRLTPNERWCTECGVATPLDYCERCGCSDLVPATDVLMPWEYIR